MGEDTRSLDYSSYGFLQGLQWDRSCRGRPLNQGSVVLGGGLPTPLHASIDRTDLAKNPKP